jgi:hypothetical protein
MDCTVLQLWTEPCAASLLPQHARSCKVTSSWRSPATDEQAPSSGHAQPVPSQPCIRCCMHLKYPALGRSSATSQSHTQHIGASAQHGGPACHSLAQSPGGLAANHLESLPCQACRKSGTGAQATGLPDTSLQWAVVHLCQAAVLHVRQRGLALPAG